MRILVLNQYFHPDGASSGQLLTELCHDLAEEHDVWVVTARPSYNVDRPGGDRGLVARMRMGNVHLLRVWSTTFSRSSMVGRVLNYLTFLTTSLLGAMRAPRPDVVMTWTDPPPVTAVGAFVARLRRVPFVLSCQDIVPESVIAAGELRNPVMIRILRAATRSGFRNAAVIVAIGRDMRDRLQAMGVPGSKIEIITNWSDGSLVRPLAGPSTFREEHGWTEKFVLMHSGNLGMGQDLDPLIDAADLLRDEPDIVIAIVGEGMRKAHLQAEVQRKGLSNVEFLPFQPKENLADSLGAADVHLVSHRRGMEGFQVPSKLYGVLATGKPCIAVVEPGCEASLTVEAANCGVVVPPDDPKALARAIQEMRDRPREELGENARRYFAEHHDRPAATAAYRDLLTELVRAEGRP